MSALDGRPIMLVGRSYRAGGDFAALVSDVAAAAGMAVQTGVIVNLPQHGPAEARRILDAMPAATVRIVDPELHLHPDHVAESSARRRSLAPYLDRALPARPDRTFITGILDLQREAGANLLLTPTGRVDETDGERDLARALRVAAAARAEAGNDELAVNLTLSRNWLATPRLLEILLNELVDSTEPIWYLRVRWDALRPRHAQLRDEGLLRGYNTLVRTAASESKLILLPQTGLAGWLLTGLGAGGFSSGTGGPEQAYAEPVIIRIRGQRRPPVPRYFDPEVLATIGLPARQRLAAMSGYRRCPCPYCARLPRSGGQFDAARWDRDVAVRHQLVSLARLARGVAAPDRRAAAQAIVAAATTVADGANPPMTGEDRPSHLGLWSELLA
jgi:hypothetical protein